MACSRCVVQRLLANHHFYRKLYPVCFKSTKAKVATKKTVVLPENSVTKNEPIENKNTEVKSTKTKIATKKPPAENSVTKDEQNKNTEVKSAKTKVNTEKTPQKNSATKDEPSESKNTEVKSPETKITTKKTPLENSVVKDEQNENNTEVKSTKSKVKTEKTPQKNSATKDEQNKNTEVKSAKTKVATKKTPLENSTTEGEEHENKNTEVKSTETKVATEKTPPKNSATSESKNTEVIEHVKTLDYVTSVPLYAPDGEDVSQIEAESQFKSLIEKMSVKTLPSVSYVISSTQSPKSLFFLKRWKEKMIAELGEEGFKDYQQDTFRQGINFHANIQEFLTGKSLDDIQIDPANEGHWRSLKRVFPQMKEIVAIETPVFHPTLYYKGVFDCVGVYKDSLCVIDWKTSKQPKPLLSNTYDSPLQVAAYIGAINSSQVLADKGIDNIKSGVLVIAYPKGYPAHVHYIDQAACAEYWKQWLERLQLYWKKIADKKLGLNLVKNEDSEYSEMF